MKKRYKKSQQNSLIRLFHKVLIQFIVLLAFVALYHLYFYQDKSENINAGITKYNRSDYKLWVDANKNGLNTRQEVLAAESLIPVSFSKDKRMVVKGLWVDPYTDITNTDPKELDIDHLVPLKNAHISGAWLWNPAEKERYANYLEDPNHLIAVVKSANRSKGDKPPHLWIPPSVKYQCSYVSNWVVIKNKWDLKVESETLSLYSNCLNKGRIKR